jgi:hypothetical protein
VQAEQTIIVSLASRERYKLIVEVANPTSTAALLRHAIYRANA